MTRSRRRGPSRGSEGSGLVDLLRSDAQRLRSRLTPLRVALLVTSSPPFRAAALHRVSHRLGALHEGLGRAAASLNTSVNGCDIDHRASLGPGLLLQHPVGVVIGGGVRAGRDLTLMGQVTLGTRYWDPAREAYPTLGDRVRIGTKASVLGALSVGDGAQIGAHALVLHEVPAGWTVRGPAPRPAEQPSGP